MALSSGPFEKARTVVSVSRIAYDSQTGEARLEVKAPDAGPRPVIRWSDTGPAVPSSPELKELSFATTKLRVWFLAEDSTGDHPTGDAMPWRNEISILHEPRETSSGRVVELKAVPGGSLRWTFGGTSPRDMGAAYNGPVPIPTDGGLLRVLAEDGDISAEELFDFVPQRRGAGEKQLTLQDHVEPGRPASLLKRIERTDTQGAFELMNEIESKHALAFGAVLTVGPWRCQRYAAHRPRFRRSRGCCQTRCGSIARTGRR